MRVGVAALLVISFSSGFRHAPACLVVRLTWRGQFAGKGMVELKA